LSTKPFNKLTGTDGQEDGQTNLGVGRLAPPKIDDGEKTRECNYNYNKLGLNWARLRSNWNWA